MKNYYEILEVDKNASKEIIDKAYKTLVKKYHPDLKTDFEKIEAESKIKEINEAYDILSDKFKREEYNKNLQNNFISIEEYNLLIDENNKLKKEINILKNNFNNNSFQNNNYKNYNNYYENFNYKNVNQDNNNFSSKYNNTNYNNNNNSDFINELFNGLFFNKKYNKIKNKKNNKSKLIPFFIFLLIISIISQLPLIKEIFFGDFPRSILILIIFIVIIFYY